MNKIITMKEWSPLEHMQNGLVEVLIDLKKLTFKPTVP